LLAWGTTNSVVQVWNKATGDVQTLRGHLKVVRGVAFSPDGSFIASASQDGTAKIWPLPNSQPEAAAEQQKIMTKPASNDAQPK
jgi:WD40 repeat protein